MHHSQVPLQAGNIHVVEAGREHNKTVLFLHGWPEDWSSWDHILKLAGEKVHALAVDLPGIGKSLTTTPPMTKRDIARNIHELIQIMKLKNVTVVGHDIGGHVAFAYASLYHDEIDSVVIMNVAVPGVVPWDDVIHNPYIWHFAFQAIPRLPEILVADKQRVYFDYFYDALSAHPKSIGELSRDAYAAAYANSSALTTGFNWYRAFRQDTADNAEVIQGYRPISTPLLYLRGDHEGGKIEDYVAGFERAGFQNVHHAIIADSGHFAPEEQPEAVWQEIVHFIQKNEALKSN